MKRFFVLVIMLNVLMVCFICGIVTFVGAINVKGVPPPELHRCGYLPCILGIVAGKTSWADTQLVTKKYPNAHVYDTSIDIDLSGYANVSFSRPEENINVDQISIS